MKHEISYIYALIDPRDGIIKYIGQSVRPQRRFWQHMNENEYNLKCNWIKKLKKEKLKPLMEVLDCVNLKDINFWEEYYISLYKSWGFSLKNSTLGGQKMPKQVFEKEALKKRSKGLGNKMKFINNNPVIQKNIPEKEIVGVFYSKVNAYNITGISDGAISSSIKTGKSASGYYWENISMEDYSTLKSLNKKPHTRLREYDSKKVINLYKSGLSIVKISELYETNKKNISKIVSEFKKLKNGSRIKHL